MADEKNLSEKAEKVKKDSASDAAVKQPEDGKNAVNNEETQTKKIDTKQAKIDELSQKLDDTEDKYLRAEAEIVNMQNRYKKEQERLLKYQGQEIAKAILPAVDNLKRALEIEVDDESSKQLKKGVEMVANDIQNALSNNNVVKMNSLNEKFDPNFHQAVKTVPVQKGQKADTVVEVYQEGYMLKDRVLRPAMVVVAQ